MFLKYELTKNCLIAFKNFLKNDVLVFSITIPQKEG